MRREEENPVAPPSPEMFPPMECGGLLVGSIKLLIFTL